MDVKPLHALMVVAVFGALMALAVYCGVQANSIQGPSDLQTDRSGHLHVRIGQQLFVYDPQHTLRDSYSLDDFQLQGLVGNFDFFADNSLLLVPDRAGGNLSHASGRFLRCYRNRRGCAVLPRSDFEFDRSFRVAIGEADLIYLADTGRGHVYVLDEQGAELNRLGERLERPNRVRAVAPGFAIAHTEGREVIVVPLESGRPGGEASWQRIAVKSPPGYSIRRNRPLDFFRLDGDWWVLAKPADMRSGVLSRYDAQGVLQSHTTLPAAVDPFAIAPLGEDIAIADYAGLAVLLYGRDGALRGELTSPGQLAHIERLRQRQSRFLLAQYACWGLFALALVAGFVIAIKAEVARSHEKKAAAILPAGQPLPAPTPKPHPLDARVHWLSASRRPLYLTAIVIVLIVAMPVALTAGKPAPESAQAQCASFTTELAVWGAVAFITLIMVPAWFRMRQTLATRIGVADEWVLVDRGSGPVLIDRQENLLRIANGFIIDKVPVVIGTPQMAIYDRDEVGRTLLPRLEKGRTLGAGAHMVWQWRNQRAFFITTSLFIVLSLAGMIAVELDWFEPWIDQWLQAQPACAQALEQKPAAGSG